MTKVLAHRGSAHRARENTLAAFAAALALGADGAELDDLGPVESLTASDLPDWVPTLEASLEVLAGAEVNVEIKHAAREAGDDPSRPLARAVAELLVERRGRDTVVVSSFDLASVDAVRAAAPEIETALLAEPLRDQLRAVELAAERGHAAVHPWHDFADAAYLAAARAAGLKVRVWTVDEPSRIAALAALGVDAVITNEVASALAALDR